MAIRSPDAIVAALACSADGCGHTGGGGRGSCPMPSAAARGGCGLIDPPAAVRVEISRRHCRSRTSGSSCGHAGAASSNAVRTWRGGEWVMVSGERAETLTAARRVVWQARGRRIRARLGERCRRGRTDRTGPRIRCASRDQNTADALPAPYGALYRGLVIGDDRDQPRDMIERFRVASSHLTAVLRSERSLFVLMAFGPLLVCSASVASVGRDRRGDRVVRRTDSIRTVDSVPGGRGGWSCRSTAYVTGRKKNGVAAPGGGGDRPRPDRPRQQRIDRTSTITASARMRPDFALARSREAVADRPAITPARRIEGSTRVSTTNQAITATVATHRGPAASARATVRTLRARTRTLWPDTAVKMRQPARPETLDHVRG